MEFKGYNLIAVVDNFVNEDLWAALASMIQTQDVNDVARYIFEKVGHDPEFIDKDELPVYDEVVMENDDYLMTYTDCGMCLQLHLYEKVNETDDDA